jgi:hypothetical protein
MPFDANDALTTNSGTMVHANRTNGDSATMETLKASSGFLDGQGQQLMQLQYNRSSQSKQSKRCELRFTWRYDATKIYQKPAWICDSNPIVLAVRCGTGSRIL